MMSVCMCMYAHAVHVLRYTCKFFKPWSGEFHVVGSDICNIGSADHTIADNGSQSGIPTGASEVYNNHGNHTLCNNRKTIAHLAYLNCFSHIGIGFSW